MPKYCVYCGTALKESDRYCIACGKPVLTNIPKTPKSAASEIKSKPEEVPEKETETEQEGLETENDKASKKGKVEENNKLKEKVAEAKAIDPETKEQIGVYIDLNDIKAKKRTLDDKLKDLLKQAKDPKYQTDFEHAESVNVQLEAVKTVLNELKEKEKQLKEKLKDQYNLEKINQEIEAKKEQLTNLVRDYKLMKIKDKDVVNSLKERYKQELKEFETRKAEILFGMRAWIVELRKERDENIKEQKFNKARLSSKEITEDIFKEKDEALSKKIKELSFKIELTDKISK